MIINNLVKTIHSKLKVNQQHQILMSKTKINNNQNLLKKFLSFRTFSKEKNQLMTKHHNFKAIMGQNKWHSHHLLINKKLRLTKNQLKTNQNLKNVFLRKRKQPKVNYTKKT